MFHIVRNTGLSFYISSLHQSFRTITHIILRHVFEREVITCEQGLSVEDGAGRGEENSGTELQSVGQHVHEGGTDHHGPPPAALRVIVPPHEASLRRQGGGQGRRRRLLRRRGLGLAGGGTGSRSRSSRGQQRPRKCAGQRSRGWRGRHMLLGLDGHRDAYCHVENCLDRHTPHKNSHYCRANAHINYLQIIDILVRNTRHISSIFIVSFLKGDRNLTYGSIEILIFYNYFLSSQNFSCNAIVFKPTPHLICKHILFNIRQES